MNRCPRDAEVLEPFRREAVAVSCCEACHGTWLAGPDVAAALGRGAWHRIDSLRAAATWLECPSDGTLLRTIEHRGVTVECCPDCGGIWLDPGELTRVLRGRWPGPWPGGAAAQVGAELGGQATVLLLDFLGEMLSGAS